MSKYTTEVRYICEMKSGIPEEYIDKYTVDEIIEKSRINIFNFSYPIYETSHRATLETKILRHYYTREICAETVGLWQLWLNAKLNDIMPKYNKLYEKEKEIIGREFKNIDLDINHIRTDDLLKELDGLRTDNLTRTDDFTRTDDLTRTDNLHHVNSHNDTNKRRYSDTPQGTINFADADSGNVWLTDYERNDNNGGSTDDDTGTVKNTGTVRNNGTSKNTGTQKNEGSEANTGTVKNDTHQFGYTGNLRYYEMLADYENKVLNIDLMIINELSDLFFGLW